MRGEFQYIVCIFFDIVKDNFDCLPFKKFGIFYGYEHSMLIDIPRSQAPAWERICARSPSFGLLVVLREAGASLQVRSQAGAWEREKYSPLFRNFPKNIFFPRFLVPKPRLGNASASEALASGYRLFYEKPGLLCKCVPKQGLGNEKTRKREKAGAWEREKTRKTSFLLSFPSPGLGTHLRPKP